MPTTAPSTTQPASPAIITPTCIIWCLIAISFVVALGVVLYLFKSRRDAATLLKAIGGGGAGTAVFAALGTQVSGLSIHMTWIEVIIVSMASFCLSILFWLGALFLCLHLFIVRPLVRRFGSPQGVRIWSELWIGVDPLMNWVRENLRTPEADRVWDEFACAARDVHNGFDLVVQGVRVQQKTVVLLRNSASAEKAAEDRRPIDLLREALTPTVQKLTSRLSVTTLNFSVWRVGADDHLEHLLSLPVEPAKEAGYGHKKPLRVWRNKSRTRVGSLAAEAMFEREYKSCTECHSVKSLPLLSRLLSSLILA